MFLNLRIGSPLYILHKNEPRLEIGEVNNISIPLTLYNTAYLQGIAVLPKSTIDIKVKINNQIVDLQKLPSELGIADFGYNGMIISESKDLILLEVELIRNNSKKILDSIDANLLIVDKCNDIIKELDPLIKSNEQREKELDSLKNDMNNIKDMLKLILDNKK